MSLRRVQASEIAPLSEWLSPIAMAAGATPYASAADLQHASTEQDLLLYREAAGEAFIALSKDVPVRQALRISFIAVPKATRRLGIGGRAALAAEKRAAASARCIYVSVSSVTGIALYFWLRLGYRPLMRREWPHELDGSSSWMVRYLR